MIEKLPWTALYEPDGKSLMCLTKYVLQGLYSITWKAVATSAAFGTFVSSPGLLYLEADG